MADDCELKSLEKRVERLEKRLDENDQKSWERSLFWPQAIPWTLVAYVTAIVVLAITHNS